MTRRADYRGVNEFGEAWEATGPFTRALSPEVGGAGTNGVSPRYRFIFLTGLIALLLFFGAACLEAANPPKKPMRETATVGADTNVEKRLGTVNDYLADNRWTEAVDLLHDLAQSHGQSLVLVHPGQAGGSKVYLNVATRCQVLLSRMPQEGLKTHRRKVDPQAKRWFENWQRTRDAAELERLVRQAYLSSYGDDALWALGEAAWDHGDFATARLHWSQLMPLREDELRDGAALTVLRYPDSSFDEASVLARLVLCSLLEGEPKRANDEHQRFAELYPQAEGNLAGRRGKLVEILRQVLDESTMWETPLAESEVATFGFAPERTQILQSVPDIGAARWQQPLKPHTLPPLEQFSATFDRSPISTHPVVFRDIVLVNDTNAISAFHLLTGEPAWPTENGTAQIYPPTHEETSAEPTRVSVGLPWFTMTVDDGKLYARLGSPVTAASDTEQRHLENDLVCLDLAEGQGRLVWKLAAEEWHHDGEQKWRFEGSPLVKEGRAYILHSRRRSQLEIALSCLDATKGERLWTRTIATARPSIEEHQNRVSHLLPTLGAGRLFVSTDAGAILAVDARDGRAEWAITYESHLFTDAADQSDPSRQGLVPPMFHEGLLFVAPNDCDRLFCIEADSGRIRWQKSHPRGERWQHLLGVASGGDGGQLIVSGKGLCALDVETGQETWKITPDEIVERGFGRGVLAGDVVLWPTREAIRIVETATGQPRRNVPLNTPDSAETGGNLIVAGGMLLVAQSKKLVAYGEYSLLKERLHRNLSAHPDQLEFLWKLAEIEVSVGNLAAATTALRTVRQRMADEKPTTTDPPRAEQFARLLNQLRRVARRMYGEGRAADAIAALSEMLSLVTEPLDKANLLFELAEAELARQQPTAAIEHWQQILEHGPLRDSLRQEMTADAEASAAIARTIARHGRGVYAAVEQRAALAIASHKAATDLPGLRRVLQQYPHAEATTHSWLELARLERQAGHFQAASSIAARLSTAAASPVERAAATVAWGESLEEAGYWRTSRRVWNRLRDTDIADQTIDVSGVSQLGRDLARQRLLQPEYRRYERTEPPRAGYLERDWTMSLIELEPAARREAPLAGAASPAKPFVPEGVSPSHALACVLIHRSSVTTNSDEGMLECLDRVTGKARWRRPQTTAPRWVAYAETHLLIATDEQLVAVTLEAGQPLWTVAFLRSPLGPIRPSVQFALREHWVVAFDQLAGVSLIDSRSGVIVWTIQPRGHLQPKWSCGTRHMVLQTLQPATTLLVELATARHVVELPGLTEPWRSSPAVDDSQRVTLVTDTRRIECHAAHSASQLWTYRGGMSFANVDPLPLISGQRLLLTIDGTTLCEVERETGHVVWTAGLCDLPLTDATRQMVITDAAVFVASRGVLRSVSLTNGERRWEQFVGDGDAHWQIAGCGPLLAVWSLPIKPASPVSVVWCDADSGRIVERLHLPPETKSVSVTGDERGALVLTEANVVALRSTQDSVTDQLAEANSR